MNKKQLGKLSKEIIEILGLEIDKNGDENMFLIRDEEGYVLEGIDFTDEVIELTQFIDDNFTPLTNTLTGDE
jgi:hypothetical protein